MPFTSILCGVERNPASTEAAKQAIALAAGGGDLQFTAVCTSFELGPDYHKDALESSLEEAARLAAEAGVSASYALREAKYAIDVLLPESRERDLLVLGTHGGSRAKGLLFGSTAGEAAHGTEQPLLIAREAPGSEPFPKTILVASDGSSSSWRPSPRGSPPRRRLRLQGRRRHGHRRQTRDRPGDPRCPARRARRGERQRAGAGETRRQRDQGDRRGRQAERLLADRLGPAGAARPQVAGQCQRADRRQRRVLGAARSGRRRELDGTSLPVGPRVGLPNPARRMLR